MLVRLSGNGAAARLLRAACLLGAVGAALTCSDSTQADVSAPSAGLAPGHVAFSIAPRFSSLPAGTPSITLATVKGLLISSVGDTIVVTAHFVGDSAVLDFNVQFTGLSANFKLDLTAFDADGVIAYHAAQDVTLRAGKNNSLSPVLVYAAPDAAVTALHVSPSVVTLNSGGTGSVSVTGTNATGQGVTPLRVGWTARSGTVSIDATGNITAGQFQGSTYVVARTAGNVADSALVKVHAPVAKVNVAPATVQVDRGANSAVGAELRDAGNNLIDDRTATWTSTDPTIATVSATGVITGVKIGTTTVTATAEGKTGTVAVTVVTPLDHIEVTPVAIAMASLHETKLLTLKLVPKQTNGSTDGITPIYTSDTPANVTVDASGLVTAVRNGSATITVTVDGLTATTTVTVKQVAATITVTPKNASVSSVGDIVKFSATALDALGNVIDGAVFTWTTSDPTVGTISSSGVFTAKRAGSASVTAGLDGKTDTGNLNVAPTIKLLNLYTTKSSIAVGATAQVTAKFADGNGNPLSDAAAAYSTSTPSILQVSASGTVTGISAGIGHVIGSSGGLVGSVDITVTGSGGGGGLIISPPTAEKLPNGTQTFSVVSGGNGPFTWTVNGIPNGNSTFGTISIDGDAFYRAPATVPTPSTFDVCASQSEPALTGCSHVTIRAIPSGGADVIVINDMNLMEDSYLTAGNHQFFKNVVSFTPVGARAGATKVMFEFGHQSQCYPGLCGPGPNSQLRADMPSVGISAIVDDVSDAMGPIDPSVKVVYLMNPKTSFSIDEVNNLKAFAADGGRIVFIGENPGYYGSGIQVENQLLSDLGAQLTNSSSYASCSGSDDQPAANIHPHQTTTGVTDINIPCATQIILGPNDYSLVDGPMGMASSGPVVPVIAVAKIDLTPLVPGDAVRGRSRARRIVPAPKLNVAVPPGIDPTSSTGRPEKKP